MSEPVPCLVCTKILYGPVKFCPYCGHAATVETLEPLPILLTPPVVKLRSEENSRNNPAAAAPKVVTEPIVVRPAPPDETSKRPHETVDAPPPPKSEDKPPPQQAAKEVGERPHVPPSDNASTCTPAPTNPGDLPKKRGVGVYIGIALVVIVAVVAAKVLLFSKPPAPVVGSSTSQSESKIPAVSREKAPAAETAPPREPDSPVTQADKAAPIIKVPDITPVNFSPKEPLPKQSTSGVAKKGPEVMPDEQIQAAIQDAINLHDDGKFVDCAEKLKVIQAVKPNNALVKFYLPKCLEAAKQ